MKIDVFEWPLPTNRNKAMAVVFELNCPRAYSVWRNVTWLLLRQMLGTQDVVVRTQTSDTISSYASRAKLLDQGNFRPQLSLASTAKSFLVTHYSGRQLPAQEHVICLNHGPQWYYHDNNTSTWTSVAYDSDVSNICQLKSPLSALYNGLEGFLHAPVHNSNDVLADQANCSPNLSLHEFIAFGALRAGEQIQWLNILREFASNDLTFASDDVYLVLARAMQQVGPVVNSCLPWHEELRKEPFQDTLFQTVSALHSATDDNWKGLATLLSIILVVIRVMACKPAEKMCHVGYSILRGIRKSLYGWLQKLMPELEASTEATFRQLQQRLRAIAGTCRLTYDVDEEYLKHLLQSPEDVQIFVYSTIVYEENSLLDSSGLGLLLRGIHDRNLRVSVACENVLWESMRYDEQGMHDAITAIWPSFTGTLDGWTREVEPNQRWVACRTRDSVPQNVQFNLLSGQFLVNGKPVGAIGKDYTNHSIYRRLFGDVSSMFGALQQLLTAYFNVSTDYSTCDSLKYVRYGFQVKGIDWE